jgi:hypothetical protein
LADRELWRRVQQSLQQFIGQVQSATPGIGNLL